MFTRTAHGIEEILMFLCFSDLRENETTETLFLRVIGFRSLSARILRNDSASTRYKFGVKEELCKRLDQNWWLFLYLHSRFPNTVDTIFKQVTFVGSQITGFISDDNLERKFNSTNPAVWKSFRLLIRGFLDNKKMKTARNHTNCVPEL